MKSLRFVGKILICLVALCVAGGAGFWAGRVTFVSTVVDEAPVVQHSAQVVEASVGQTNKIAVSVIRPQRLLAVNYLEGTVTAVKKSLGKVKVGASLFEVGGVPVRAIQGKIPFYRDLYADLQGKDVKQLNNALVKLGFLKVNPGDKFTRSTTQGVKLWQEKLGLEKTGVVSLGELVAAPSLPSALSLGDSFVLGGRLAGGEPAVYGETGKLLFQILTQPGEVGSIPVEAPITVSAGEHKWQAVVSNVEEKRSEGAIQVVMTLTSPKGGSVCGKQCGDVPPGVEVSLYGDVVVVPETSGLSVPVAAVRTDNSGGAYVALEDGTKQPVTVLVSGQGVAIVEGVQLGQKVLLDE